MTIEVGVGGVWKDVAGVQVGVGGVWKTVSKAWVGVGGVWKVMYTSVVPLFESSRTISDSGIDIKGSGTVWTDLSFQNDGVVVVPEIEGGFLSVSPAIGTGEWLASGGTPGDWDIRLTRTAGSDPSSGPALGGANWHNLGTTRTWNWTLTGAATSTLSGTYTVDFSVTGAATASYTFTGLQISLDII